MPANERRYLSYLLRLWKVKRDNDESWHASLENPHTNEQYGFSNIETLMKFLLRQTQGGGEEKQNIPILKRGKD